MFEVLDQVVVETEALKTQKEIHLNAPPLTLTVEAERRYLHRVVQNLVGNAVRYGDHQVLVSGGINDSGMAYVCVEDDGPGIPEDERERVFEAFARLDDSRTRASGGYGLGLSIVSRIAYWFGGSVKVDQSPSLGGARFPIPTSTVVSVFLSQRSVHVHHLLSAARRSLNHLGSSCHKRNVEATRSSLPPRPIESGCARVGPAPRCFDFKDHRNKHAVRR